mmetsp:Transcript_107254/g.303327  ORF Transcript_107254/g.303327 Transcript_107254/m.303327 type:complete len:295 (-) Transcript_107254:129-1013(-)|eukprot:CAMPEP_0168400416 /NCGR_PEP_ID=MMETSP0228-20121227/22588_1 /TAXON_ID=133427 /ORGANISM="Protoceratium reticulatum, Strain CCCM 535 (=CCMP 1889)" /LENGTH=294 /DNA_ID=CAMNT_0008413959 /DNA_START=52 /DNA_END=936 /DNA_ORIENTATION=-
MAPSAMVLLAPLLLAPAALAILTPGLDVPAPRKKISLAQVPAPAQVPEAGSPAVNLSTIAATMYIPEVELSWYCGDPHEADYWTPFRELLEYPNMDLFCHFSPAAPWIAYIYALRFAEDGNNYVIGRNHVRDTLLGVYRGQDQGPLLTYKFDGAPARLRSYADADNFIRDDPYCYTLGFLQNQGLNATDEHDMDLWEELALKECEKIQAEFNFTDSELSLGAHLQQESKVWKGTRCAAGLAEPGCQPVTRRDYKLSAYQKCAMGDLGHDMAFCLAKGCLLEDNFIGHFVDCDEL